MPDRKRMPRRIEFSQAADADLIALVQEGLRQFGDRQSSRYPDARKVALDQMAGFPLAARIEERLRPPMRMDRFRSHVVIYVEIEDGIRIVRLRHGRQDWLTLEEETP